MDVAPVTNKEFGKFVRATYYETEAEKFGWSFVLSSFLPNAENLHEAEVDPEAEDWVAVDGAYWRNPEGPGTSYKYRENHPVVHVSHRDAAEYCTWVGKRLPGEREWEAAARGGNVGPKNRTLYVWGDDQTTDAAKEYANLWGDGDFPWDNKAEDGWRATSPVKTFNQICSDLAARRKTQKRIVRGGSYVDSLDGSFNHAATLGVRATLHGTTTTVMLDFDASSHQKEKRSSGTAELVLEDEQGNRKQRQTQQNQQPQPIDIYEDDDEFDEEVIHDPTQPRPDETRKRVLAVKPRTVRSDEL
ncbi:formylglycine-generating enzyme [Skeletonema marinoi]|uniref:Formylglycine-generating enzyme n=1 Tax=Skeletonema marinoi TaxID=267567 RepID=A0AAD9DGJ2_9STRA|nr:formylglycine-generating enzyme [Skeletonema marinoi]